MSDKVAANIRTFVANGGGVVAMHESSLFNEMGDKRQEFALADLFGASYLSEDDHTARWPEYLHTVALQLQPHPITDGPVIKSAFNLGCDNVDYIGMASKIKARVARKLSLALRRKSLEPFLLISEHGKGKVVYFAGPISVRATLRTLISMSEN